MTSRNSAIIWFRNDLRIHDNESLTNAINHHNNVIAVYCFDPRHFEKTTFGFQKTANFRAKFLVETVTALKKELEQININLVVHLGYPEVVIPKLIEKQESTTLYFQKEWTAEEQDVEDKLLALLPKVKSVKSYQQFLFHPDQVYNIMDAVPDSFSSFRKKIEKKATVSQLTDLNLTAKATNFDIQTTIPTLEDLALELPEKEIRTAVPFNGGEASGLNRLHYYLFESKKASYYKKTRNGLVGQDYSTKFSPWLANGSLSAKKIYHEIKSYERKFGANTSTYWIVFELLWRDFFKYMSLKHKNLFFRKTGIQNKTLHTIQSQEKINDWIQGTTTDDFVNANMIELKRTGWMSNRGRQNVASYLVHDLKQDWRIGASYFESLLLDYDVHSNYGNWMYVAGVGNNKRDSKFNTKTQAENYDSNHKFRKLWLTPTLF